MSAFGLVALAYFAAHIHGGKRTDMVISAAGAGLAWLTKSPMLVLVPLAAVLAWWGWRSTPSGESRTAVRWLGTIALWGVVALAVFTLFWPAMWANPLAALDGVLSYARGSAQGEFSGPIFFNGQIYADGRLGWASVIFYPLSFLWRSTPLVLLGLVAALWARPWARRHPSEQKTLLAALAGFALLFIIAMSIAEKKFDRYMLPAYAALLPVAAWGLAQLIASLQARMKPTVRRWAPAALVVALLGGQLWASAANFPYYLQHYNRLFGSAANAQHSMMLGWGEGLERAAQYLQGKTNKDTQVASWYSNLFTLFYGEDVADIPILAQLSPERLDQLLAMDYLVIYIHQWQRGTPQNLLAALQPLDPDYSVWINGLEYVRVYHLNGD
jgi:4-amino-4-deoxy-L-arabinose transferase-like glycosyltransferase